MFRPKARSTARNVSATPEKKKDAFNLTYLAKAALHAHRTESSLAALILCSEVIDLSDTSQNCVARILLATEAPHPPIVSILIRNNLLPHTSVSRLLDQGFCSDLQVLDISGNHFIGVEGGQRIVSFAKRSPNLLFVGLDDTNIPCKLQATIRQVCYDRYMMNHAFEEEVGWLETIFNAATEGDKQSFDGLRAAVNKHVFAATEVPAVYLPMFKRRWGACIKKASLRFYLSVGAASQVVACGGPSLEMFVKAALPATIDPSCLQRRLDRLTTGALPINSLALVFKTWDTLSGGGKCRVQLHALNAALGSPETNHPMVNFAKRYSVQILEALCIFLPLLPTWRVKTVKAGVIR